MAFGLLDPGHAPVLVVFGAVDAEGDPGPAGADSPGHRVGDQALDRACLGSPGDGAQLAHARIGVIQDALNGLEPQSDVVPAQVDEAQEVR